jgi:hypothetical protein
MTQIARLLGLSRRHVYLCAQRFATASVTGLLARRRGPKPHTGVQGAL